MKKVLIADDDYVIAELLKSFVEESKAAEVVAVTHSYADTVEQACNLIPDVAFIDVNMDYATAGIDACRFIKGKTS